MSPGESNFYDISKDNQGVILAADRANSRLFPDGEPSPVQASHPESAENPPFDPVTISLKEFVAPVNPYNVGCRKPRCVPNFWLSKATRPLHNGATVLVPPITSDVPSTDTL